MGVVKLCNMSPREPVQTPSLATSKTQSASPQATWSKLARFDQAASQLPPEVSSSLYDSTNKWSYYLQLYIHYMIIFSGSVEHFCDSPTDKVIKISVLSFNLNGIDAFKKKKNS